MPRGSRFKKPTKGSVFGRTIENAIEDASRILNAIDFIESPQGLNIRLYPLQRLVVKCIFAVPIDYKSSKIPMWDVFREKLIHEVTEGECLHILHEEGRCNVNDWRDIPNRGFNEAVIFAGRRGGKMLHVDELIPTPKGFIPNGDLVEGDEIFGEDGGVYKVKYAHPIEEEEAFKVSFDDGTFTYAHAGHLWHTYTKEERKSLNRRKRNILEISTHKGICACGCGHELEPTNHLLFNPNRKFRRGHFLHPTVSGGIRTTEDILKTLQVSSNPKKDPQANHSIPLACSVLIPEKPLPLDPYCLGAWLGDSSKNVGRITGIDSEILDEFVKAGYVVKQGKCPQEWGVRGLYRDLAKAGVLNNKHIPHDYLWASAPQRLSLLQGLMDTDGSCMKDGQCEFSNTNKELSEGVYTLAASLGLKPYWSEKIPVCTNSPEGKKACKRAYLVKWTGRVPVFRLKRKLGRLLDKTKTTQSCRYITNIEPAGKMRMRCITTTNPTGLYLFGKNFNVTHNSQVVSAIGAYTLYKLLNVRNPQDYFGLVPGSPVDFTFMAQDDSGASRLYEKLREDINRAPFFNPYLKTSSSASLGFVSDADRMKRDTTPTINVRSFPCLDENELIWTSEGLTPIKDVCVGQQVLDLHAKVKDITSQTFNEERVLALETANFRRDPLLLTPQHTCIYVPYQMAIERLPYLHCMKKKGCRVNVNTISGVIKQTMSKVDITPVQGFSSELAIGDYLLFPQISNNERHTEALDNIEGKLRNFVAKSHGSSYIQNESNSHSVPFLPVNIDTCRLYGLYLAEGSISGNPHDPFGTVRWTFNIHEKETYARFIQDTLLSEFGLSSTIREEPKVNKCYVYCCSIELGRGLARWFGKGGKNKNIPTPALYWNVEYQQSLIRGYLDGDGSDNRDIAQTVSKKLAYSLFALAIQAGQLPSVMYKPAYIDKRGLAHADSWVVEMCKTERHYRFFQEIDGQNYYWSKITKIVDTEERRRVVDIEVKDTHSFLTKMASVHNCTTNASRGPSNIFLALDEFAHFRSAKGSASDEVYAAATPSTVNFKHAELISGGWVSQKAMESLPYEAYKMFQDSLVLSISSPWTKVGKMYDLHKQAIDRGTDSGIFTIRVSSAEMNPTILPQTLRREYEKNPLTFKAEYGGQFLESSESYVTEDQIRACTDVKYVKTSAGTEEPDLSTARFNLLRFHPSAIGRQYFWAIDLGMMNDATAVAIGHLEYKGGAHPIHLVYDYIDRMMVGEKFESIGVQSIPGIDKYIGFKALPLEDVLSWFKALNEIMPCYRGATDQHGGQQLVQLLELNKIHNIELINLTTTINSQMAYVLQGYIRDTRCQFPYVPKFLNELRLVEAEYINKYQIRVQAPMEKGSHDDMVDVAQLCSYVAQKWIVEEGGLKIDPSGQSIIMSEQLNKPAGLITSLDGVMMRDLQVFERMKKNQINMANLGTEIVRNPFHRRGR